MGHLRLDPSLDQHWIDHGHTQLESESKQHVRATMQLQMMHCQSIFVTSLVIVVVSLLTDWGRNVGKRGNKIFSQTFQRNVQISKFYLVKYLMLKLDSPIFLLMRGLLIGSKLMWIT